MNKEFKPLRKPLTPDQLSRGTYRDFEREIDKARQKEAGEKEPENKKTPSNGKI